MAEKVVRIKSKKRDSVITVGYSHQREITRAVGKYDPRPCYGVPVRAEEDRGGGRRGGGVLVRAPVRLLLNGRLRQCRKE